MSRALLLLALAPAFLAAASCKEVVTRTAEYQPEDSGTVDRALCLLGFAAVPLREVVTGHHLVEAELNGRTATFVVDTGANATVLDTATAADLGLSTRPILGGAVGLGGNMRARQAGLDRFEIGGMPIRRDRILVADLSQISRLLGPLSGGRVDGIIGQDVMKEHRAVIDVARPLLYLIAADEEPAPVAPERCRAGDAPSPGADAEG